MSTFKSRTQELRSSEKNTNPSKKSWTEKRGKKLAKAKRLAKRLLKRRLAKPSLQCEARRLLPVDEAENIQRYRERNHKSARALHAMLPRRLQQVIPFLVVVSIIEIEWVALALVPGDYSTGDLEPFAQVLLIVFEKRVMFQHTGGVVSGVVFFR